MKTPTTKIKLERIDDFVNFKATNSAGKSIIMDGTEKIGAKGNGVGPMEALLMAMAGCTGIDVITLLRKMNQQVDDFKIEVEAERSKHEYALVYSHIHIHYHFLGPVKESKVEKSIDLSMERYCSVTKMLKKTAEVTTSYTLHS